MAELVQVVAAVAILPLMALAVLAWGHSLFGRPGKASRRDERQGAVIWTLATLAVSAVLLGGWMVPRALTVGLLAAGLAAGVVVTAVMTRRPQQD